MVAADDYSATQLIGGAVARLSIPGLLVPSARATGTNLVVYVTKRDPTDIVEPRSRAEEPAEDEATPSSES